MNMIAKKLLRTSSLAPVDGEDVLAVLDHRLRELDARRTIVTRQIITHEKTSSERIDPSADVGQAEAMLKGAEFVLSRERPITALARLHAERQVIDRALAIGRSRQHRLATERAGDIWANHFAEIAEMEKRRVMVVLELQRVNRDREKLREHTRAINEQMENLQREMAQPHPYHFVIRPATK
jgi:hypothetical protein